MNVGRVVCGKDVELPEKTQGQQVFVTKQLTNFSASDLGRSCLHGLITCRKT